ncbi:MAG TPA: hypothetical protein GX517_04665 [Alicyclobacillus sp.]|nr:hypothetical protein [Alicyclobacillus sp.]
MGQSGGRFRVLTRLILGDVRTGCFGRGWEKNRNDQVGKEGKGRRDIREVAGAWKGHEELLKELRHLREDWD